jgi:DNA repair protein RAD7
MESLVKNCPNIIDLRLKEIGHMNDSFLDQIKLLRKGLRHLDLADPTESCTESAMIRLMQSIGKSLTYLNVSKHALLGDQFLSKGLQTHAKSLQSLSLSHLPELTDEGVSKFFGAWKNPSLLYLDMSRNEALGSLSLESLVKHSGKQLEELNINGWKDVGEDALKVIGLLARELKKLDVGWCRAVDDFLLKMWFEGEVVRGIHKGGCERLQEVKVWGCNKISHSCPRKVGSFPVCLNLCLLTFFCRRALLFLVLNHTHLVEVGHSFGFCSEKIILFFLASCLEYRSYTTYST